ncbi:MarR family winged helix-turn-helix transcriptional regulator [Roseibium sp. SCP14]|uniref:MarR family winged helix-turn-helix transcriptional regulator n=1 Tax=Roseibium sp. SCP14 TaxID=3141375 RepID=UPI003336A442
MSLEETASAETRGSYNLDEQVGYILRLASQRHAAIFQEHAVLGLTPTQFSALIRLNEVRQCSQNQLGRLTSMDVATIKGVVDRLRAKELIELNPDPNDKRRALISLTEKGESLIEELYDMGHVITRETLGPLTTSEQKTFLRLLKKLA